ncbi:MAG: hypothetical protein KGZ69_09650 [Methylomonas sp.]|nr:hypothetical protein [Methylomonas sp.]
MIIHPKRYAEVIQSYASRTGGMSPDILRSFARILFERGDSGKLREIMRHVEEAVLRKGGGIRMGIVTADASVPVAGVPKESIVEDRMLGAGIRARIGDTLVDTTIARKISNLKRVLS